MNSNSRLTADRLNERGCMAMLYAMARYMSAEFRVVYTRYLSDPFNKAAYNRYVSIRNDFLADRFSALTRLDGRRIVSQLEAIVSKRFYAQMAAQCANVN